MSTSKMLVSPKGLAGGGLTDSRRRSRVFKDDKFLGGDTTSSLGPSSPGKDRLSEKSEYHRSDYGGLDLLKNKIEILEADLARRQESYIRRERAYKTRYHGTFKALPPLLLIKMGFMLVLAKNLFFSCFGIKPFPENLFFFE